MQNEKILFSFLREAYLEMSFVNQGDPPRAVIFVALFQQTGIFRNSEISHIQELSHVSLVFSIPNDYFTASSGVTFLLRVVVVEIMLLRFCGLLHFFFPLIVVGQRRKLAKFFNLSDLALHTLLLVMFSITLRSSLGAGILSLKTHL